MKRLLASVCLATLPLGLIAPPASAQWITYDPANHIQSILGVIQAVEQVTNQIEQISNEIKMLENMAKDLEKMPDSIAGEINDRLFELSILIDEAEGFGYQVEEIERDYEIYYPKDYGARTPQHRELAAERQVAWEQSRVAYRDTLKAQAAVVRSVEADIPQIARLLESSQNAEGNLAALQAGNQLQALAIKQDMQLQELMAAQYRAEALERAERLAEKARADARLKSFLGDGDAYAGARR